jgi:hypothetical protein
VADETPLTFRKYGSYVVVSEEVLAMAQEFQNILATALDPNAPKPPPPVDPGPNPEYLRLLAAAEGNPLAVELLGLHAAEWTGYGDDSYRCSGDHNGDDYEYWPCETVAVVAGHLGVELGATP